MPDLLSMFSAFIILGLIVAVLSKVALNKPLLHGISVDSARQKVSLTATCIILGIGIGGFIDGIVLHQILQWHQMLSHRLVPNTVLNKNVNMFWDGIFHLFTLIVVFIGILLLYRLRTQSNKSSTSGFSGGLLCGWGIFNIVEGTINHHILQMHNVREITSNPNLWNYGFLIFSILIIVIGWSLIKQNQLKTSH